MLAAALVSVPAAANDATTAPPATTQPQQTGSRYYEEFCDILRITEVMIGMQDELKGLPPGEAQFRVLTECAKKASSKTGQQLLLFDNPQIVKLIKTEQEIDAASEETDIMPKLEAMAADGRPDLWTALAAMSNKSPDLSEEERSKRALHYLQRAAEGGSDCGMVSLAGTHLKNNTPGLADNVIPDWCAQAIIAHNLNLTGRRDNWEVRTALRVVALDYLLRGKGSAMLATAAMYLELALAEEASVLAETGYLLGEALRHLPEGDLKDRHKDCLDAYLVGARAGHPAAMNAVAEILSYHPAYSEAEIEELRRQAVMAGYNPFNNYLKEIQVRSANVDFHFREQYLYLLNRDEIEKIHEWAKNLLPRCPRQLPADFLGNVKGFLSALADEAVMAEYMQAAEKPDTKLPEVKAREHKLEATVEPGEIGLLKLVRNSTINVKTAMALDGILRAYENEAPQYKAITRVLRLANLHRVMKQHDEYGLSAALSMLVIERELGGVPGCTESQRNDLLRVFSGIYRRYLSENATPAAEVPQSSAQ